MIDLTILKRALIVCLVLEVALVACGWFLPQLRPSLMFGCMMATGVAGMLYARDLKRGFLAGMLGGAILGAAGGVVAVAGAAWAGEEPQDYLPYGVMVMTLTGAVGGFYGEISARMHAYIVKKLTERLDS